MFLTAQTDRSSIHKNTPLQVISVAAAMARGTHYPHTKKRTGNWGRRRFISEWPLDRHVFQDAFIMIHSVYFSKWKMVLKIVFCTSQKITFANENSWWMIATIIAADSVNRMRKHHRSSQVVCNCFSLRSISFAIAPAINTAFRIATASYLFQKEQNLPSSKQVCSCFISISGALSESLSSNKFAPSSNQWYSPARTQKRLVGVPRQIFGVFWFMLVFGNATTRYKIKIRAELLV